MQTAFDSWLATAFPASPPKKASKKARLLHPLQRRPLPESSPPRPPHTHHRHKPTTLPALQAPLVPTSHQLARFHSLVAECSCHAIEYNDTSTLPRVAFFRALASANQVDIGVQVPSTFFSDGKGGFTLLYTATSASILQAKAYATKVAVMKDAQQIVRLLTRSAPMLGSHPADKHGALVCYKVQQSQGNDLQFLQSNVAVLQQLDSITSSPTTIAALQEYIQPKGSKTWLVRSVWQCKHPPFVWVLSDHEHNFVDTTSMATCHIDKCTTSSSWPVPKAVAANLVCVLESALNVKFALAVVDLIQSEQGQWWLTQVKAFRWKRVVVVPPPRHVASNQDEGTPRATCANRSCKHPPNPNLSMLYKDVLFYHFDNAGHDDPAGAWEAHLACLHRKERNRLYNRAMFCDSCYALYAAKKAIPPAKPSKTLSKPPVNTDDLLVAFEAAIAIHDGAHVAFAPEDDAPTATEPSPGGDSITARDSVNQQVDPAPIASTVIASPKALRAEVKPSAIDTTDLPISSTSMPAATPSLYHVEHALEACDPAYTELPSSVRPSSTRPMPHHLDTLWATLAPAPVAPSTSAPLERAATSSNSIVVLPRETIDLDASRFFFDDSYKRCLLATIRTHFQAMHCVQVECTDDTGGKRALAIQTLFLDVQDECIEGQYGLFQASAAATSSLTLTPFYSMPR
ncbi:hypothetical protein H310_02495 [Aphanomyces invadans]|uniref:Uncharacterized protein n=1 Tax=Aphanomyces invadans TaxID=157072 RepID=A0A024URA7_9STRA|nr:hypothetical protein H310_02495 [Aphanomyces invadans]ETW08158.1 hypothetical protein H310_02495 [Aphanomyces invadans]|eukprot:XP_008864251.1 hypothetical protein H310_02495 [Aphanomyces invadans]